MTVSVLLIHTTVLDSQASQARQIFISFFMAPKMPGIGVKAVRDVVVQRNEKGSFRITPSKLSHPKNLARATRTRMEKPHRFTPIHRRAPTPGLPRAGESYDHPAFQSSVDDGAEWSTLPKSLPPAAQSKATKFLLTRTRAPSPMGSREAEAGKRPRITLYRPPPCTVAIDLPGLESRYSPSRLWSWTKCP